VDILFGIQCLKLASFVLWPFGYMAVNTPSAGSCLALFLNIIWIFCGGLWLAIGHIAFGI
jgi:uncharacterized membrane protein YccF (DUF307 family)